MLYIGALITRIGFGVYHIQVIIRNPQNPILIIYVRGSEESWRQRVC